MSRHLDNLVGTAKRSGKPIAFVIMDIDFFKAVNDGYVATTSAKEFARGEFAATHLLCTRHRSWPAAMAGAGVRGGDA